MPHAASCRGTKSNRRRRAPGFSLTSTTFSTVDNNHVIGSADCSWHCAETSTCSVFAAPIATEVAQEVAQEVDLEVQAHQQVDLALEQVAQYAATRQQPVAGCPGHGVPFITISNIPACFFMSPPLIPFPLFDAITSKRGRRLPLPQESSGPASHWSEA